MKSQGIDRSTLPYHARLNNGSVAAYYAAFLICIILFFSSYTVFLKGQWDAPTFITNYLPVFLAPVLYFAWKLIKRTRIVRAYEMDFITDIDEIEAEEVDDPPPKNFLAKVGQAIF
jgi:amino acid transporter